MTEKIEGKIEIMPDFLDSTATKYYPDKQTLDASIDKLRGEVTRHRNWVLEKYDQHTTDKDIFAAGLENFARASAELDDALRLRYDQPWSTLAK